MSLNRTLARLRRGAARIAVAACALSVGIAGEDPLGRIGPEAILELGGEWRHEYDAYEPDRGSIAAIAAFPGRAVVDVSFGAWCSDSVREVPRFLKIVDTARNPRLKVRYVAVDRSKRKPARHARRVGLERVPTFVVRVDGGEIGRIVETPRATLERDLADLLARVPAAAP